MMKKALTLLPLIALVYTANAQNAPAKNAGTLLLNSIKADTSVAALTGVMGKVNELNDKTLSDALAKQALKQAFIEKIANQPASNTVVYSTMPVAGLKYANRMPVVKPGNANTHYTMLVKKIDIVDPTRKIEAQAKPSVEK